MLLDSQDLKVFKVLFLFFLLVYFQVHKNRENKLLWVLEIWYKGQARLLLNLILFNLLVLLFVSFQVKVLLLRSNLQCELL